MESIQHVVRVSDWSETPGARYRSNGPHSGEEFRDVVLIPAFDHAVAEEAVLLVDLDGGYGYAAGFLEEVFGGLARRYGVDTVLGHLRIKTEEEPRLDREIRGYITGVKQTRS